jgi:hypothetical protein
MNPFNSIDNSMHTMPAFSVSTRNESFWDKQNIMLLTLRTKNAIEMIIDEA